MAHLDIMGNLVSKDTTKIKDRVPNRCDKVAARDNKFWFRRLYPTVSKESAWTFDLNHLQICKPHTAEMTNDSRAQTYILHL